MAVSVEQRRRIRAARRLLQVQPESTVDARMTLAADILTGKAGINAGAEPVSKGNAMADRVRRAVGRPPAEDEREETGGRDRKKRGGRNRSA